MSEVNPLIELQCLNEAINHFDGNKSEFARAMKTSSQNVNQWTIKGTIPTSKALQVERATNGAVKARDVLIENEILDKTKI